MIEKITSEPSVCLPTSPMKRFKEAYFNRKVISRKVVDAGAWGRVLRGIDFYVVNFYEDLPNLHELE